MNYAFEFLYECHLYPVILFNIFLHPLPYVFLPSPIKTAEVCYLSDIACQKSNLKNLAIWCAGLLFSNPFTSLSYNNPIALWVTLKNMAIALPPFSCSRTIAPHPLVKQPMPVKVAPYHRIWNLPWVNNLNAFVGVKCILRMNTSCHNFFTGIKKNSWKFWLGWFGTGNGIKDFYTTINFWCLWAE